jgi:uncharacterized protein
MSERISNKLREILYMGHKGLAFIILIMTALELLLLKWGLQIPNRAMIWVLVVFLVFLAPVPYLMWLNIRARQPSRKTAILLVRPVFAWQFNWMFFLITIGPLIVLARASAGVFHSYTIISVIRAVSIALISLAGGLTIWGLLTTVRTPQVVMRELVIPGLARKDDGIRLVQMTDIHFSWRHSREEMQRNVDIILGLNPDLLILSGDMVDHNSDYIVPFADCLEKIQPRLGRFAIMGNHDVYTGGQEVAKTLSARGFRMLGEGHASLVDQGVGLVLAGMDDSGKRASGPDPEESQIPGIIANCPKGLPIIYIGHRPSSFDKVIGLPVALTLSGHTHGGQFRVPYGERSHSKLTFKRDMGLYREGEQMLYVSRGTGSVGWPFRLWCSEEITLLTLRSPEAMRIDLVPETV